MIEENNSEENIQDYTQAQDKKIKNTKKKKQYCSKNLQSRKKIRQLYSNLREGLENSC